MVTLKLNESSLNSVVRHVIFLATIVYSNVLLVLGKEPGGGKIHETTNRSSDMPSQAPADLEQPVISKPIGAVSVSCRPRIPVAMYLTDAFMNSRRRRCDSWDGHSAV